MEKYRKGEEGQGIPFRTGRFFCVGLEWYFATREGIDRGPYPSKQEAEAELHMYIRDINTYDQRIVAAGLK